MYNSGISNHHEGAEIICKSNEKFAKVITGHLGLNNSIIIYFIMLHFIVSTKQFFHFAFIELFFKTFCKETNEI